MTSLHRPRPSRYAPRIAPSARDPEINRAIAPFTSTAVMYASMDALSGVFAPTPPLARSAAADGCVYATGNGSSENQQSAMKRPVPDGFMTSPPQSVSIPMSASAVAASSPVSGMFSPPEPCGSNRSRDKGRAP